MSGWSEPPVDLLLQLKKLGQFGCSAQAGTGFLTQHSALSTQHSLESLAAHVERPSAAERKAAGSFFTPPAIVRFMCRWALQAWREAMGSSLSPQIGDGLRVLDPAAGAGAFLLVMLDELAALGVDRRLAVRSLAGVELRPEAAAVARLRLWQAAGADPGLLPLLDRQVQVGDALLETGPGTFDLVIGNPPYLGNRYFEALADPAAYRARLRGAFGWNDDLYVHFVVRSFDLARPGGLICLITPNTYLAAPSKRRLRDLLLGRRLLGLVLLGPGLFDARVHPAILLARNEPAGPDDWIEFVDARHLAPDDLPALLTRAVWQPSPEGRSEAPSAQPTLEIAEGNPRRYRAAATVYRQAPDRRIYLPSPENRHLAALVTRLSAPQPLDGETGRRGDSLPVSPSRLLPLGQVAPARDTGIHSGNVRHRLFFRDPVRPGLARLLQGSQIGRYAVRWDAPAARYRYVDLDYRPDPAQAGRGRGGRPSRHVEYWHFCGDRRNHEAPEKILIRQTEDDLVAGYLRQDGEVYYTDNTLFTVLIEPAALAAGISYRYLLGLLNSATLGAIYHFLAQESGKAQAQVRIDYLNRLPIFIPTPAEREQLEQLVDRAIAAQLDQTHVTPMQAAIDRIVGEWYEPASGR